LYEVPIDGFADDTIEHLDKEHWEFLSQNLKLLESFIFKWAHKINFNMLKCNSSWSNFEVFPHHIRRFSKKFNKIFPEFSLLKPCVICFVNTNSNTDDYFAWYERLYRDCEWKEEDIMDNWLKYSLFREED
jgi:hypothetical protein